MSASVPARGAQFGMDCLFILNRDDEDSVGLVTGWRVALALEETIKEKICCGAMVFLTGSSPHPSCDIA